MLNFIKSFHSSETHFSDYKFTDLTLLRISQSAFDENDCIILLTMFFTRSFHSNLKFISWKNCYDNVLKVPQCSCYLDSPLF